jgi:hypothetical protein
MDVVLAPEYLLGRISNMISVKGTGMEGDGEEWLSSVWALKVERSVAQGEMRKVDRHRSLYKTEEENGRSLDDILIA